MTMPTVSGLSSVPHFRVPFVVGPTGSAQTVQQDTPEEVTQSVAMLCGTRPGTRLLVPAYGTPDPAFFPGAIGTEIELSVSRWEKRAKVSVSLAPGNSEVASVSVSIAQGTLAT